jgi:hypothetical protein
MPKGVYERKPMSEETRRRMSEARKGMRMSDAAKEKLRAAHTGKTLTTEHRAKLSAAKLGKPGPWTGKTRGPMPPEWRAAIRASAPRGPESHRWGAPAKKVRWVWYDGVHMRSTWEARFAAAMNRRRIQWQYEPTTFDLGSTTYTPDFRTADGVYWEVKGWLNDAAQRKLAEFRRQFPEETLVVVTKPVLQLWEQ